MIAVVFCWLIEIMQLILQSSKRSDGNIDMVFELIKHKAVSAFEIKDRTTLFQVHYCIVECNMICPVNKMLSHMGNTVCGGVT